MNTPLHSTGAKKEHHWNRIWNEDFQRWYYQLSGTQATIMKYTGKWTIDMPEAGVFETNQPSLKEAQRKVECEVELNERLKS